MQKSNIKTSRPLPIEQQTDEELNRTILTMQAEWWNRQGTQAEHKQYKKIMMELLQRQKRRQRN